MDRKRTNNREEQIAEDKERLLTDVLPFLSSGRFIHIATNNAQGMPNVAPKLIAKVEGNVIYAVDYVMGKTYVNLKWSPKASLSLIDEKTLTGYQLNGVVDILETGEVFDQLCEEFRQIKTRLTVERILLDLRSGKKHRPHELSLPEKVTILKIKVFEIVEIASSGGLRAKLTL